MSTVFGVVIVVPPCARAHSAAGCQHCLVPSAFKLHLCWSPSMRRQAHASQSGPSCIVACASPLPYLHVGFAIPLHKTRRCGRVLKDSD